MKKVVGAVLALSMIGSSMTAFAAVNDYEDVVSAVGITTGQNMDSAYVTRGDFAQMIIMASPYSDSVGSGYGYSLYSDVKEDNADSAYIKVATENGYMTGYINGTFRPDENITLEVAVTSVLKVLGYDSANLVGAFPTAQLSKASSLGLLDNVSTKQGQALTTDDAIDLFYNMLHAKNAQGQVYATTLGYTVTNGVINYASLVSENTSSAYVADSKYISVPFDLDDATIYKNGKIVSQDDIMQYDVYYYNEDMETVWVYGEHEWGVITAIAPNTTSPTSVTVGGKSYSIDSADAAYKLSVQGEFAVGDDVSLLIGMNGTVVDVVDGAAVSGSYYGMVQKSETVATTNGKTETVTYVACTDGITRTFSHDGYEYAAGTLISLVISEDGIDVSRLSEKSLSGTIGYDASGIGSKDFSADISIIDVDSNKNITTVYPYRLASTKISSDDVLFYATNKDGEITDLILNNVTGDSYTYGFATDVEKDSANSSSEYTIMGASGETTYKLSSVPATNVGGVIVRSNMGNNEIIALESVDIEDLTNSAAIVDNGEYKLSDNVIVLVKDGNEYISATMDVVKDGDYDYEGWYDDFDLTAGSVIRVIVASPN